VQCISQPCCCEPEAINAEKPASDQLKQELEQNVYSRGKNMCISKREYCGGLEVGLNDTWYNTHNINNTNLTAEIQ
jgi:hypothetical protein